MFQWTGRETNANAAKSRGSSVVWYTAHNQQVYGTLRQVEVKTTEAVREAKFNLSPPHWSQVVGVAQAINKKCGEDGAFTDQDEKVSGVW